MKKAKEVQKRNYDKSCRNHHFKVGDHVYRQIEHLKEDEDSKLKKYYKGKYTIVRFQSDTNVVLADEHGKELPRSVYINKLKKCKLRKNIQKSEAQYQQIQAEDTDRSNENYRLSII